MLEFVVIVPVTLDHHITRRGMSRKMKEPQGAPRLSGPNKKRRIIGRFRCVTNVSPKHPLNEGSSAITVTKLDQVRYAFVPSVRAE